MCSCFLFLVLFAPLPFYISHPGFVPASYRLGTQGVREGRKGQGRHAGESMLSPVDTLSCIIFARLLVKSFEFCCLYPTPCLTTEFWGGSGRPIRLTLLIHVSHLSATLTTLARVCDSRTNQARHSGESMCPPLFGMFCIHPFFVSFS